jgi:hypothetical protein
MTDTPDIARMDARNGSPTQPETGAVAVICSVHKGFCSTDHEMGAHDEPNT